MATRTGPIPGSKETKWLTLEQFSFWVCALTCDGGDEYLEHNAQYTASLPFQQHRLANSDASHSRSSKSLSMNPYVAKIGILIPAGMRDTFVPSRRRHVRWLVLAVGNPQMNRSRFSD